MHAESCAPQDVAATRRSGPDRLERDHPDATEVDLHGGLRPEVEVAPAAIRAFADTGR
jgi:hypothetical protein